VLRDVPTMGEFVPGYEASNWFGLVAPKNTASDIIDKLNKQINEDIADPQVKARLLDLGATVVAYSSVGFGRRIAADADKMGPRHLNCQCQDLAEQHSCEKPAFD
jgi:tripartite-type tricarboxylate transporter receptor subunit TctC